MFFLEDGDDLISSRAICVTYFHSRAVNTDVVCGFSLISRLIRHIGPTMLSNNMQIEMKTLKGSIHPMKVL